MKEMLDLPPAVRIAFDELRRVRAMTQSVELTLAAGRHLVRIVQSYGFTEEEGTMLAFRAIALGNQDWFKIQGI